MMNLLDIYVGRDAYDYTRFPSHYLQETNVSEERIESHLNSIFREFKSRKIPWYLVTITTFEVGGEVNTVHYHNAHPMKEKIILNKQAKDSAKQNTLSEKLEELLNGHHGLAVNINPMTVNGPAVAEPQHWMWNDEGQVQAAEVEQVEIDD